MVVSLQKPTSILCSAKLSILIKVVINIVSMHWFLQGLFKKKKATKKKAAQRCCFYVVKTKKEEYLKRKVWIEDIHVSLLRSSLLRIRSDTTSSQYPKVRILLAIHCLFLLLYFF